MWREQGIDAGLFSRGLMDAAAAATSKGCISPPTMMHKAYKARRRRAPLPLRTPPGARRSPLPSLPPAAPHLTSPHPRSANASPRRRSGRACRGAPRSAWLCWTPSTGCSAAPTSGTAGTSSCAHPGHPGRSPSSSTGPPTRSTSSAGRTSSGTTSTATGRATRWWRSTTCTRGTSLCWGQTVGEGDCCWGCVCFASHAPPAAAAHMTPGSPPLSFCEGLWDNLHDDEIADAVMAGLKRSETPSAIAQRVLAAAIERAVTKNADTPYARVRARAAAEREAHSPRAGALPGRPLSLCWRRRELTAAPRSSSPTQTGCDRKSRHDLFWGQEGRYHCPCVPHGVACSPTRA